MEAGTDQYLLLTLMEKGGVVMYPLLACSLLAVGIIIERLFWGPTPSRVMPQRLMNEVNRLLAEKRYDELLGLCRADKSPLAQLIVVALRNAGRSRAEIKDAIEMSGRSIAIALQRYLPAMATIAAISPLLGLLGTVFGMISAFSVIETEGLGNSPQLAGGIAEALITTAAGLSIAIFTVVFHHYFQQRSKKLVLDMELLAMDVLDRLTATGNQPGSTEAAVSPENQADPRPRSTRHA